VTAARRVAQHLDSTKIWTGQICPTNADKFASHWKQSKARIDLAAFLTFGKAKTESSQAPMNLSGCDWILYQTMSMPPSFAFFFSSLQL
jgi:hypothetical protein